MLQNYKIFIKDVPLLLANKQQKTGFTDYFLLDAFDAGTLHDIISNKISLQNTNKTGFLISNEEPEKNLALIKNELELVRAAGGIVWNNKSELLMIYRRGKWDLPKGRIEKEEETDVAALREVEEECGVGQLQLLNKFDVSYHIFPESNRWMIKETHWFNMISSFTGTAKPQKSEGITQAIWVNQNEVKQKLRNTYGSIKDLVERVLQDQAISTGGGI